MAHDVSAEFIAASEASVNDPTYSALVSWDKQYNESATFFTLDESTLDGPDFLKGFGDDITFFDLYRYFSEKEYVKSISITHESSMQPYGLFMAQADVRFDNTSKRFMPSFDPDIGNYVNKPNRPIKLFAGLDGENVPLFTGFSSMPKSTIVSREMTLHAFDVIEYLNNAESDIKYLANVYIHDAIIEILESLGFTADQYSIEDSVQGQLGYMPLSGLKVGQIFTKFCEAEGGLIFANGQGKIVFWNRFHFMYIQDAAKSLSFENLTDVEYSDTPIINYVRVKASPREVGDVQQIWRNSSSIEIGPNSTVRKPVNFIDENNIALPITTAQEPVYIDEKDASHLSYYQTNENAEGSGATNSGVISVTDFDVVGDVAFIEFTNSGDTNMFITELVLYGTPARIVSNIEVEYKDQSSIDNYGINPSNGGQVKDIQNDFIQNRNVAYSLAYSLVSEYSEANQQLRGNILADPRLEFGDWVELTIDDTDEEPRKCILLGQSISMGVDRPISHSVVLDQRNDLNYFRLDYSMLDGPDVLAV